MSGTVYPAGTPLTVRVRHGTDARKGRDLMRLPGNTSIRTMISVMVAICFAIVVGPLFFAWGRVEGVLLGCPDTMAGCIRVARLGVLAGPALGTVISIRSAPIPFVPRMVSIALSSVCASAAGALTYAALVTAYAHSIL